VSDGIIRSRRSNGQKIDLNWYRKGKVPAVRQAPDHQQLHALYGHPHRAVSPLALNRLLVILAERLLFDLDSLHNAALGGDRQISPISIHEETVVLAIVCKKWH
jgi:prolyl-tRNA editing enzyme YbaK/EbsC (Cys-tRNA(Pro) deacylase)